jgi:hypothetical protein
MEQHIYSIRSYLPVEFEETDTNEFIDYLVDAYLENLPNEKYQFSFTAFHMLYMSYAYKIKWSLRVQGNNDIENSLQEFIKQNRGVTFNTLFDLSQIPEKSTLDKLLKTLNFHANDVDLCKNLVEVRNKCAHASGKIYFKRPQQVENYILEELENVESIHRKILPTLTPILEKFINDRWAKPWVESDIKIWIQQNYFSQKDIIGLLNIPLAFLKKDSNTKELIFKKVLYASVVNQLQKHLPEKGTFFIKSLSALMKGLTETVDIKSDPGDAERLKNTQEIIEETILPLLTSLTNDEALEAQNVLKLNTA